MASKFVSIEHASSKREAMEIMGHDWAKIIKVDGGWMFFDSLADYKTWKAQK